MVAENSSETLQFLHEKLNVAEAEYNKQVNKIEDQINIIKDKINKNFILTEDAEKLEQELHLLCRALQIAEIYAPDIHLHKLRPRHLTEKRQNRAVLLFQSLVSDLTSFIRATGTKKTRNILASAPKIDVNLRKVLNHGLIKSTRNLTHLIQKIEKKYPVKGHDFLTKEKKFKPVDTIQEATSFSLDYMKENWTEKRIVLDGIANHMMLDSGGSNVWVQAKFKGKWIDAKLAKARLQNIPKEKWTKYVTATRIVDDGLGYDHKYITTLRSKKRKDAVGQFGEGLKMIMVAAERLDLGISYQSGNWRAQPVQIAEPVYFIEEHDRETGEILEMGVDDVPILAVKKQFSSLEYRDLLKEKDLSEAQIALNKNRILGSRTTFSKPNVNLIDEMIMKLDENVLHFKESYTPLFKGESADIVSAPRWREYKEPIKDGEIYVKGFLIQKKKNLLFSYDIKTDKIGRDRDQVIENELNREICKVFAETGDKKIIRTLLKYSEKDDSHESKQLGYHNFSLLHKRAWQDVFYEMYGKNAILHTDVTMEKQMQAHMEREFKIIKPPHYLKRFLQDQCNIPTLSQSLPENVIEFQTTNKDVDHMAKVISPLQAILNFAQNHLPTDSGGTCRFGYTLKHSDDILYEQIPDNVRAEDIEYLFISDLGRGYNAEHIYIESSSKTNDEASVGKYGRGMKDSSAAAVGNGMRVEFYSKNWHATSQISDKNGSRVLDWKIFHQKMNNIEGFGLKGSRTMLHSPTEAYLNAFRDLQWNILDNRKYDNIDKTESTFLLKLETKKTPETELFIKGVKIPGTHNLAFDYNMFGADVQHQERNIVMQDELTKELHAFWGQTKSEMAIQMYLEAVQNQKNWTGLNTSLEFLIQMDPKNKDIWQKAFNKVFNANTTVASLGKVNYKKVRELQLMGYNVLELPEALYSTLRNVGIAEYTKPLKDFGKQITVLSSQDLSTTEQENRELLYDFDTMFVKDGYAAPNLKIFEWNTPELDKVMRQTPQQLGKHSGGTVYLHRSLLSDVQSLAKRYLYERGFTDGRQNEDIWKNSQFLEEVQGKILVEHILANLAPELQEKIANHTGFE